MADNQNKTIATSAPVTAFIDSLDDKKKADALELIEILKEQTGFEPVMWGSSIIGFGSYHYKYESGREGDMPLAGFSPRKKAISLYLCSDYKEKEPLLAKLGKHKASKGCVYINKLADVNTDVLRDLIDASTSATKELYPD